jgi:hypothetical protein
MPQAQKAVTEDDYWAASDESLVLLRGVIEYVGGTLCGSTRARVNVSSGGIFSTFVSPPISGPWVHYPQPYTVVPTPASISAFTSTGVYTVVDTSSAEHVSLAISPDENAGAEYWGAGRVSNAMQQQNPRQNLWPYVDLQVLHSMGASEGVWAN